MNRFVRSILSLLLVAAFFGGCATPTAQPTPTPPSQLPNPASQNCIDAGGTLVIEKRPDGGEYGVCLFEDNRQCEEWALFRGECPLGGVKIAGYVTAAARYCAITGGTYQVTANSNTEQEQGTCTFENGKVCDAGDYFAGKCDRNAETGQGPYSDPFAYCAVVGTVDAPDARYSGDELPEVILAKRTGMQTRRGGRYLL